MAMSALLFTVYLLIVLVYKSIYTMPIAELRRQARNKKLKLQSVYQLASRPGSVIFLWILSTVLLVGAVIFANMASNWLMATMMLLGLGWLMLLKLSFQPSGLLWSIAKISAKPLAAIMSFLSPPFDEIAKTIGVKSHQDQFPIYEKHDLLSVLQYQKNSSGKLEEQDTKTLKAALDFNTKTISQLAMPISQTLIVPANETIGPHLMEDLYETGLPAFLVADKKSNLQNLKLKGLLLFRDITAHRQHGKVKDLPLKNIFYINEDQSLKEALEVLLSANQPLLVVMNKFNEISGTLYLKDILENLVPGIRIRDIDTYSNPKAVAAMLSRNSHTTSNDSISVKGVDKVK